MQPATMARTRLFMFVERRGEDNSQSFIAPPSLFRKDGGAKGLTRITRITRTRSGGSNGWRRARSGLRSSWEPPGTLRSF